MAKFCSLYSSSDGNCTYIGCSQGGILIDVGISAKRTELALNDIGVDPRSLAAIFVTHEHNDHVKGIRVFAERYGIKVFSSEGTLLGMEDEIRKTMDSAIFIPRTELLFQPSLSVVVLQTFAYYVALMRGCDVDKPRHLAKSGTVE